MQYQSESLEALKSVANIRKPFEKVFMDAMKLFMAIPDRINFLQMGRYGKFSEQTYRNHFENESFDWYAGYLIKRREHLQRVSNIVVADAFFSKSTFITPMCDSGFHVISRFRNNAVLSYPTTKKPTGRRGRPKLYDGHIDFSRLDTSRCTEHETDKGKLYGLTVWSKALKRMVSLAVWYPDEGRTDKWQSTSTRRLRQSILPMPLAKGWEYRILSPHASR